MVAGAIIGGAISAGGALIGGSRAASAAAEQAEKQNEATIRRYQYDTQKYDMDKQQIRANRNFAVQEYLLNSVMKTELQTLEMHNLSLIHI